MSVEPAVARILSLEAESDRLAMVTLLSAVAPRPVEWLDDHRIPRAMVTMLDGDPGLGKSTLLLDYAARLSRGWPMPDGTRVGVPWGTVILSAEDDLARTIRPRLDAAGADVARIATVAIREPDGGRRDPTICRADLEAVEFAIDDVDAALLIIDPLVAYLPAEINANRDQDVRRSLAALADLAERTNLAVVALRHLRKAASDNALYRGGGSIGIIGAARAGLLVAPDPDDEDRRILAVTKANLAPLAPSLAFRLVADPGDTHPHVVWEGVSGHSADALLAVHPGEPGESGALDEAMAVLRDILAAGPVPSKQARAEARDAGIADRTLDRARHALDVTASRVGGLGQAGRWEWSLPAYVRQDSLSTPPKNLGVDRGSLASLAADPELARDDDPEPDGWAEVFGPLPDAIA